MITLVILVGVGTAVDGVVELLEPPGARAVLLGDAAARGHLPVEGLCELLSEHFCAWERRLFRSGQNRPSWFLFENVVLADITEIGNRILFFSPFPLLLPSSPGIDMFNVLFLQRLSDYDSIGPRDLDHCSFWMKTGEHTEDYAKKKECEHLRVLANFNDSISYNLSNEHPNGLLGFVKATSWP